ncbi:MAG TPA: asparagine synthase-related protein [Caulobacteraceae bacterium]
MRVLRDPSGAAACYYMEREGTCFLFSDVDLPLSLGLLKPRLDQDFVAHHLAYPNLRTERTGLNGVRDLLAGARLSLSTAGSTVDTCWTPWAFARPEQQVRDRVAAVQQVRTETERCVRAWASGAQSIVLELSGGLDSSIVAACLADQPAQISAVTLVTPDPGADERRYASLVAKQIASPLDAVFLDVNSVQAGRSPRIALPRPGLGLLQQAIDGAFYGWAADRSFDCFITGGGGDNVFCSLATAAPAADALIRQGPGGVFLQAVSDLADVHGATVWRSGWLALKKAFRRPIRWKQDVRFLAPSVVPPKPFAHPWLDAPPRSLHGSREHIVALMSIQNISDGKERLSLAPIHYPLLSQPLVELCLRIPSWMWIAGGRNRAVARDAFEGRLPSEVLSRRLKGDFTGFCGALYERNRQDLKDLLLGGWLDQAGILDPIAVEAYLANTDPPTDLGFYRLLEMAGVEAWARSWAGFSA